MKKETYEPTEFPGIKKRLSDGKYIVTVDFGRTEREDKKTGKMRMMQNKTTRIFSTLKEAKSFQGKNANKKERKKVTDSAHKIGFTQAMKEFQEFNYPTLEYSARNSKETEAKRMMDYFTDKGIRKIDTIDIEKYFRWCQEPHENWPTPLSTNSLKKVKSHSPEYS